MALPDPFTVLLEPGLEKAVWDYFDRLLNQKRREAHKMWKDVNGVHLNLRNRQYFKFGTNINGVPAYICIGSLSEGSECIAVHLKSDGTVHRLNPLEAVNVEHPFVEPSIIMTQEMYQGMQMIGPIDKRAQELVSRVEKEYNTRMISLYFKSPEALSAFVEEFPWTLKV